MSSAGNAVVTRRLAAIVIADVVGYTRLMERDDTGTFSRLRNIRDEVVDPAVVSPHAAPLARERDKEVVPALPAAGATRRRLWIDADGVLAWRPFPGRGAGRVTRGRSGIHNQPL